MPLASLPNEVLFYIIARIHTLEDLSALFQTSLVFHKLCLATLSDDLYNIFIASYPFPHQLLLAAVKARQLADWAIDSPERTLRLNEAVTKGREGLCDFAISIFPLTLKDLRTVRMWTHNVLYNVQARLFDFNYHTYKGMYSSQLECHLQVQNTLLDIHIYTELFHHAFDAQIAELSTQPPPSTETRHKYLKPEFRDTRLDFFRYCYGGIRNPWLDSPFYGFVTSCRALKQLLNRALRNSNQDVPVNYYFPGGAGDHIMHCGLDEVLACLTTGNFRAELAGRWSSFARNELLHRIWLVQELCLVTRGSNDWEQMPDLLTHPDRYQHRIWDKMGDETLELVKLSKQSLSHGAYGYFKKPYTDMCADDELWRRYVEPPLGGTKYFARGRSMSA